MCRWGGGVRKPQNFQICMKHLKYFLIRGPRGKFHSFSLFFEGGEGEKSENVFFISFTKSNFTLICEQYHSGFSNGGGREEGERLQGASSKTNFSVSWTFSIFRNIRLTINHHSSHISNLRTRKHPPQKKRKRYMRGKKNVAFLLDSQPLWIGFSLFSLLPPSNLPLR